MIESPSLTGPLALERRRADGDFLASSPLPVGRCDPLRAKKPGPTFLLRGVGNKRPVPRHRADHECPALPGDNHPLPDSEPSLSQVGSRVVDSDGGRFGRLRWGGGS